MKKKLYRSNTNKQIAGVCGGLGRFLNIDPTIVRVLWAILALFYGSGILIYLICAMVIPEGDDNIIDV